MPRVHLRCTDSTNERARALAIAGAPDGTLVTAAEQTAGRGRQGRRWLAPAGSSLLMSLLVREPPELLPLIAAVAVCDAVGERAQIKWPNDIVLPLDTASTAPAREQTPDGQLPARAGLAKLAGILLEGRLQEGWAVVGIGVNVAVRLDELARRLAAAPAAAGGGAGAGEHAALAPATLGLGESELEPLLARVLAALTTRIQEPASSTLRAWAARDALYGREISWAGGSGLAHGIDGTGRLIVALAGGGRTTLGSGEVHLRRLA